MADRHPACNCDAPMPEWLCYAVCFERRDDVGVHVFPGTPNNPARVAPPLAGNLLPAAVSDGGRGSFLR